MSACKYCDAPIGWNRLNGKWQPTNADGSPHYCKSAKRRIHDVLVQKGRRVVERKP